MAVSGLTANTCVPVSGRPATCRRSRRALICLASGNGHTASSTTIGRLLADKGAALVPGVYDALSARVAQQAGHKAAYVSGAAVSATQLGEADLGLLTAPEMARTVGQICQAVDVPVLADADTGGGNVLNVQRTIRELIAAGAKGCLIDDTIWPKQTGQMRNREVVSMDEMVAKILAARHAIGDSDFFLIVRTDVRSTSAKQGLEAAITRANLFVEAGADATQVGAPRSLDELRIVAEKTNGVRMCNMLEGGLTPMMKLEDLAQLGFQLVVYPVSGLYAATRALIDVYGHLEAEGSSRGAWDRMVSWRAFNEIVGIEERYEQDQQYATGEGSRLHVKVKALTRPVTYVEQQ